MASSTETADRMMEYPRTEERLGGLRVLVYLFSSSRGTSMGQTETDIIQHTGLQQRDLLEQLAFLENGGWVTSKILQAGTAGPYARHYKLVRGVEIVASKPGDTA